jgi:hypothetical protein
LKAAVGTAMAENFDEAARFADRIVYDGKTGPRLIQAQRDYMLPEGAESIAQYVIRHAPCCAK